MATITLTPTACTSAVNQWVVLYNYLATNSSYYPRQFIFTYPTNTVLASDGANITSVTIHGYVRNGASALKQLRIGFRTSESAGVAEWASIDGMDVLEGAFNAIDGWDSSGYGYERISRTYSGNGVFAKWIKQQFKAGQPIYMGVIQPQSGKSISTNTTLAEWTIDVEYELLGNIPTVDKSSVKLTESITTTINRVIANSTTALNYKIGDTVLSTVDIGTSTSHTYTVPGSAGQYFPTTLTSVLTVEAVTSLSGASYGTISTSATLTLPEDAAPTVSLYQQLRQWKDGVQSASQIDAYVQNQSGYTARLNINYKYGSTITSAKAICEGNEFTYTGQSIFAGVWRYIPFTTSGEVWTTFTVVDSRGLECSLMLPTTVLSWEAPTIQGFTVTRATNTGVEAIDGTCAKVTATASVSSLIVSSVEKNTLKFLPQYRQIGSETWMDADAIQGSSISSSISGLLTSNGTIIDTFDDMTGYEFRLCVSDLYGTSYATDEMPTKEQFWDIDESTGRMGFGGDAPTSDDDFSYRFHEPVDLAGGYKIYSTSEVDTGNVWIDGSRIYRAVVVTTTNIVNGIGDVATLPSNIVTPVSFRAFAKLPSDSAWRPIPNAYHGNSNYNVLVYFKDNVVSMGFGSAWAGTKDIIIIVEYTKTAGSSLEESTAGIISIPRGTCLSVTVNMTSDGQAVTMGATDHLVLTVREVASASSPVLLSITGENGSNVITIHEADTASMAVGKYSAEIRLYRNDCVYSAWGIDASDSRQKNLKNFVVLAGVGE